MTTIQDVIEQVEQSIIDTPSGLSGPECVKAGNVIIRMLKEASKKALCEQALQALEDMESTVPCDNMCGDGWCEEHCTSKSGAKKECWAYYLTEWKAE